MVVTAHTPARPPAPPEAVTPRGVEPTLEARLAEGPLPLADCLAIAEAVLSGLARVHARGALHRDVRPGRVSLGDGATLIAPETGGEVDLTDPARALWLSPEQAGLLERDVDRRSDLYALGALLFACLTGRPPFTGSLHRVLRDHLSADPPDLRALRPEVPRALVEVVRRLLAKDPRDRYQTAEGARADVLAIARALAAGEREPTIVLGASEPRATLVEPALVGRAAELAAVDAALARLIDGQGGGLLAITSEAGGGKSRLLEEAVARAARRGIWTLHGRGVERSPERPLALFEGVAKRARAAACADPAYARHLRATIGDHFQALRAALPDWAPPEVDEAQRSLGPETFGEARSLTALVLALQALGTPERPALVVLDDLQWADELTREVVRAWATSPEARASLTLLLVAVRSEGGDDDRASSLAELPGLALAPLGADDLGALVTSMAGRVSEDVVALVQRVSGGNPFLARMTLEGLVEDGALVAERGGWRADPRALAEAGAPARATTFLARRLGAVPDAERRLITLGALLGRTFTLADVASLGGVALADARAAIDHARRAHLVWSDGLGERATFAHDRLRAALLDGLAAPERKELHRRAALHFQAHGGMARAYEIAWHLAEADAPELALPYALAAGDEARARFAFAVAERYYRVCLAGARAAEPALRARITEALGAVLVVRGAPDARAHLDRARDAAVDDLARARIDGLLGELAAQGDRTEAIAPLGRGLGLLGHRVPRTGLGFALALLVQVLALVLGALVPRRAAASTHVRAEHELLAARLHYNLAYVLWFRVGRLATLWALLRALRLARRHPESAELADVLCGVGVPLAGAPVVAGIGRRWLARGLAIARARGDLWVEGRALDLMVFTTSMQGRYPEVVARGREAIALLTRTGDAWHLAAVRATVSCALYRLGDLAGAIALARPLAEADTRATEEAGAAGLSTWARAAGGRLPRAATAVRPRDEALAPRARMARLQAEAVRLLAEGRVMEAARVLADAERLGARAAGARQEVEAVTACWRATALREALAELPPHDARARDRVLAELRGAVRRARRWTRQFPGELPHALREAGLLAAIDGRPGRARSLIMRSVARAEQGGERVEAALGRLWLARVEGGAEAEARARAELAALGAGFALDGRLASPAPARASDTPALVDRLATLLEIGRAVVATWSRDGVVAALRRAATTLLRGERVEVHTVGDGRAVSEPERALVEAAIASRRAVVSEGEGARSAMALPVIARDRVALVVWVGHDRVGGLFGEEDRRLGDFVAALAGAALDNAEAAAELGRANDELVRQRHEIGRLGAALVRGQEEERRRLARALHDGAGQVLTLLAIELDREAAREPDAARGQRLRERSSLVNGLLLDLRRLSHDLHPATLEQLGLGAALRELASQLRSELVVEVALGAEPSTPSSIELPPEVAVHLFRITQGALANVVRHARASRAVVSLERRAGGVRLSIEDDGVGFEPAAATGGLGLVGMRERAAWLGGTCAIDSAPGRGTRVVVSVPEA